MLSFPPQVCMCIPEDTSWTVCRSRILWLLFYLKLIFLCILGFFGKVFSKFSRKCQPRSVQSSNAYSLCGSRQRTFLFRHHMQLFKKDQCGSAFITFCSIHLFLFISVIFFILFPISSFFLSAGSPSAGICQNAGPLSSHFFSFVPRGVSAVTDPFLKIRVTKAALILIWQRHEPFFLLQQLLHLLWLVLAEKWEGERYLMTRGKFCPYRSVSLQILSIEELELIADRQTSLREKIALVMSFLTYLQNSALHRERNR